MSDFMWLVWFYGTQFKNKMLNPSKGKIIKFFLLLIFAAVFFPIVHQLFYFIFKHFSSVPIIGGLLVDKLLSTFYLTFSVMIMLSAVVSAIPVLYFSRDMDFLFSAPVKAESIFAARYFKIIVDACWMILLLAIPIFAAYLRVMEISAGQYVFILVSHIPFFIITASAGILLTLVLVRFFPAASVRNVAIAVFGIFVVFFLIYFRMLQPEKITGAGLNEVGEFLKNLRAPDHFLLPHSPFVGLVKDITAYGVYNGLSAFFYYLSASVFVLVGVILAARYMYFKGFGKRGVYQKSRKKEIDYSLKKPLLFLSHLSKDFKYLIRDTTQWIQLVFLAGIVVIYLFNIYMLPAELFNLKNLIYFLNIGFIGLILSAVGARFILPVISIEGRGFWIFKTAPFSMTRYMLYKFIVYSVPVVIVGQAVALLAIKMLDSEGFINFVTVYSVFFTTIVISAAGTGFGALFADFGVKNPEDLITGVGGAAYMFLSFLFVSAVMALEAGMVRDYYFAELVKKGSFVPADYAFVFIIIAVMAVVVGGISLFAGVKRLEKMEV